MRKNTVAGNWKMNTTVTEAVQLSTDIINQLEETTQCRMIIIPPTVNLMSVKTTLGNSSAISLGAQNCSEHESGAYTGENSSAMLKEIGAEFVLIGHSERRTYYFEDNSILAKKVDRAIENDLLPIYCCGEGLDQRNTNQHFDVVQKQITEGLFHLSASFFERVIIAYEPVWAIGTGETASPKQAQEMHSFIRELIANHYSKEIAENTTVLYGGSCKPTNARELFSQPDIDGGLIGGASLIAKDFIQISQSF